MYYNREPSRKTVTTAGDGGKFSSRRVAPSAVHVGSVYAGRGKCFRIPQVGIGCRRRWKRCQNLKRNAPAVPPPLWLWLNVSSLFHDRLSSVVSSPPPPLSSCLPLSGISLCYVNCFKLGASSPRLFSILVAFPLPFRARHILRADPLAARTKPRFRPSEPSLLSHEECALC